jgi:hypothetical protein
MYHGSGLDGLVVRDAKLGQGDENSLLDVYYY